MGTIGTLDLKVIQKLHNELPSTMKRIIVLLAMSKDSDIWDILRDTRGEGFERGESTWGEIFLEPDSSV